MERLTIKEENGEYGLKGHRMMSDKDIINIIDCGINKLGQLEDLEEEIGIDLITLLKAIEDGVWAYEYEGKPIFRVVVSTTKNRYGLSLICESEMPFEFLELRFEDYGKTWALTKEELMKDYQHDDNKTQKDY